VSAGALGRAARSWVLYDWANSAYALAIMTAILPIYFKDVAAAGLPAHRSTAYWGYANTLATLCVAAAAPILGALADYRGYKRRLLAAFLMLGVSSTALLAGVGPGQWLRCLIIYVLSVIGFAGANIFYDAFLVDVCEDADLDRVSAAGYAWGYIGSTIPFVASLAIIRRPGWVGLESSVSATRLAFLITALWWFVFALPLLLGVRQRHGIDPRSASLSAGLRRLAGTLRAVRRHRPAFLFLLAYFFYIDGVSTIIKMAAVFGRDVGIGASQLLIILLVVQVVAFPSALLFGQAAGRFGTRRLLLLGIGVYLGITIFAAFLRTALHYWILALLVAGSQGGVQSLSRSWYARLIPREQAAEFFGFYNVFGKFAAILGPLLVAAATQLTRSSRLGILSLAALFFTGGLLLLRAPSGSRQAGEALGGA
jgi:UMF1 family MFS transporter